MNVPYYLTIDKGLVHFGSEVRKISYIHAIRNLTKFIFVKTTSIKKIPKKEVGRWSQN